jgi:hypothetical protein
MDHSPKAEPRNPEGQMSQRRAGTGSNRFPFIRIGLVPFIPLGFQGSCLQHQRPQKMGVFPRKGSASLREAIPQALSYVKANRELAPGGCMMCLGSFVLPLGDYTQVLEF